MAEAEYRKGFTLVEVLVSVVIATISLIGIYAASVQCLKQIWSAREVSRANQVINYEMENLYTTPWANIQAHGSSYTISSSDNPALDSLNSGTGTVYLSSLGGNPDILRATIEVAWSSRNSASNTAMDATIIISKNGFLR